MRRSSVLLPQPDGPISETNSPGWMVRSMSTSASTWLGLPRLNTLRHTSDPDRRRAPVIHRSSAFGRFRMRNRSRRAMRPATARPSTAAARMAV